MNLRTAELCDRYGDSHLLHIAEPILRPFGARSRFSGRIATLKVFEDEVLIRTVLGERAEAEVLVIDGGGSHRCALLGRDLVERACTNGWLGIVVYGCIRDSAAINELPIGIRALHTHPLRAHSRGTGDRDSLISFAGVNFRTGFHLYADEDGILVTEEALS